jgi:hypothetical protein
MQAARLAARPSRLEQVPVNRFRLTLFSPTDNLARLDGFQRDVRVQMAFDPSTFGPVGSHSLA